jgi:hypothetical protein
MMAGSQACLILLAAGRTFAHFRLLLPGSGNGGIIGLAKETETP